MAIIDPENDTPQPILRPPAPRSLNEIGLREEDWPTTPEGIATLLAYIDSIEEELARENGGVVPSWTDEQLAQWEADRLARKRAELSNISALVRFDGEIGTREEDWPTTPGELKAFVESMEAVERAFAESGEDGPLGTPEEFARELAELRERRNPGGRDSPPVSW